MTEATRDLFMEWFQRFGTTLRDDEYEGIIEALTEHDRQVAERAWDEGARWAAVELGAIDNERQAWITPTDNPYRQTEGESNEH